MEVMETVVVEDFFKNGNGSGYSSPPGGKVNNLAGGRAWKSGCAGGVG